ncbi:ABC transporter permease [Pandoraea sp. NPDC090278]|uniref:ABC transporter permease n=1 Tax=Pandoraea sp. NPDC090278 TaxID=3364391 RepID=UPI00383BCC7C
MNQYIAKPVLELSNVSRWHDTEAGRLTVLSNINLRIHAGEIVAIKGISGSGKSTLLHILGALDAPSQGDYRVDDEVINNLDADSVARIRGRLFGFVFQRYHLIAHMSALENVCVPLLYAGYSRPEARRIASECLKRVGLETRQAHRPSQLSGGQQQRVAIARALANGGSVIFADEPTGALDANTGRQIMDLFLSLNEAGHTIVLVTHDARIASLANRVVQIEDGHIVSDVSAAPTRDGRLHTRTQKHANWAGRGIDQLRMNVREAAYIVSRVPLQSFLTTLGVAIGISAVASVVAVGDGAKIRVLKNIERLGPNVIEIVRGKDIGDISANKFGGFGESDINLLHNHAGLSAVSPVATYSTTVRSGEKAFRVLIHGVNEQYPQIYLRTLKEGAFFSGKDVEHALPVIVIDQSLRERLFGSEKQAIGKQISAGPLTLTVVGVEQGGASGPDSRPVLQAYIPYTSFKHRLSAISNLTLVAKVPPGEPNTLAEKRINLLLELSRGQHDFYTRSLEKIQLAIIQTARTFSLMILAIAVVSLMVGGIGVMNMMLVSVSERTYEIGLRMAMGARSRDILSQFLSETSLLCTLGGALGIVMSIAITALLPIVNQDIPVNFSWGSVVVGIISSCLVGLTFGYVPAIRAARMSPVRALAAE